MGFGLVFLYEILTAAPAHSEDTYTHFSEYTSNYQLVATGKTQWYSRQIPQTLARNSSCVLNLSITKIYAFKPSRN